MLLKQQEINRYLRRAGKKTTFEPSQKAQGRGGARGGASGDEAPPPDAPLGPAPRGGGAGAAALAQRPALSRQYPWCFSAEPWLVSSAAAQARAGVEASGATPAERLARSAPLSISCSRRALGLLCSGVRGPVGAGGAGRRRPRRASGTLGFREVQRGRGGAGPAPCSPPRELV